MAKSRIKAFMSRTPLADRVVRSAGRSANKMFDAIGKDSRREAARTTRMASIAELEQRILFRQARSSYRMRRLDREIFRVGQSISTGEKPGVIKQVLWWMIDTLWFFWDLLWGFLGPIFTVFLFGLAKVVLMIAIYAALIYVFYLILTA